MTVLPADIESAVVQAQTSVKAALADGLTRVQVELGDGELKIQPVAEQFLSAFADYGDRLRVFFPDAGAAALARRDWGETPYPVRGMSDRGAAIQEHEELFLFIEPSSVEVEELERYCTEAGARPVILLNPRLEDIATVGIGYAGRQLRERFLNQWQSVYYCRPIEGGSIFRAYPERWQVYLEQLMGNELIYEGDRRPAGEDLDRLLMQTQAPGETESSAARPAGLLAGMQSFLKALSS
jgi:Domain of unknown function (DUF1995)